MKTLWVGSSKGIIGKLEVNQEEIYSFQYDAEWIASKVSFPISIAMPLQKKPFGNKTTLSFFENLLPEGYVKKDLEASTGKIGPYQFLKEFGKDCAGAIWVKSSREIPMDGSNEKQKISIDQINQAIDEKRSVAEVIAQKKPGYLSLAGAQDKFPALYENNELYLPLGGQPTTHIVKTPIWRQGVTESVYNEYYCMQLAKQVGLNVPSCQIIEGTHPLFVIDRYDRSHDKTGKCTRIHQQDFCQAQGILSSSKYESEGGPSLADNWQVMMNNVSATSRIKNMPMFLDWICFNLLIGNNDSHSKNISFLMTSKMNLAPYYDLLSTGIYRQLKNKFAFKIGERDEPDKIRLQDFHLQEERFGIKKGFFVERLLKMAVLVESNSVNISSRLKKAHPNMKVHVRIEALIKKKVRHFQRIFGV